MTDDELTERAIEQDRELEQQAAAALHRKRRAFEAALEARIEQRADAMVGDMAIAWVLLRILDKLDDIQIAIENHD